jgi:hypothetical protein
LGIRQSKSDRGATHLGMSIFNRLGRSKATKEQLEHLGTLLQRKTAIEEKLFAHTAALEKAYIDASQELGVTMKGRIQDMAVLGEPKINL